LHLDVGEEGYTDFKVYVFYVYKRYIFYKFSSYSIPSKVLSRSNSTTVVDDVLEVVLVVKKSWFRGL